MTKEPWVQTTPELDGIIKSITYGNPKASFGTIASKHTTRGDREE